MNDNYIPKWITDGPLDFEYRYYNLLAEVERLKSNLEKGDLSYTYKEVDDTLSYIYRHDASQTYSIEKAISSQFIGIDPVEINSENTEEDLVIDKLIDNAIELFEDLYEQIREIWIEIESGINIEYVPRQKYFLNDGFVFIITADNKLHSYYFNKPINYQIKWRSFKIKHINTVSYKEDTYLNQLKDIGAIDTEKIIFKVNCNSVKINGFVIDVIKSMIYDTLKKDYSF